MKLKHKALIKDLELQIDFLCGYSPQGLHWKQEYHFRENLIGEMLSHEQTPKETRDKINSIMEKIFELKRKETGFAQPYLNYQEDYKKTHKVKVTDNQNNEFYEIEI